MMFSIICLTNARVLIIHKHIIDKMEIWDLRGIMDMYMYMFRLYRKMIEYQYIWNLVIAVLKCRLH